MLKIILSVMLPFLFLYNNSSTDIVTSVDKQTGDNSTGTLQKMIVASGTVMMKVDLNKLNRGSKAKESRQRELRFAAGEGAFFKIVVFNNELRGPLPSSMDIIPHNSADIPSKLNGSYQNLVVEYLPFGSDHEMAIRDGKTGFIFFNIEGQNLEYDTNESKFTIQGGRVLLSKDYATELGRPSDTGTVVGEVNITLWIRAIEITQVVDGEVSSSVLPAGQGAVEALNKGPDVIVGDLRGLYQPSGSSNATHVGLAVGTDSCNFGDIQLNWYQLPNNDHPVIPQNLYRMSGGGSNTERFEQIGQSFVKHAFTALQNNICGFGCVSSGTGTKLGVGCSDPYEASLNGTPGLGSRAWINPFTGAFPAGTTGGQNTANNHTGHSHTGPIHRILTPINDLNTTLNAGATYYTEAQYITPHEYAHCQANPGQCNMYNNVSYRQFSVSGTGSPFSFSAVGATVRTKSAVDAWTGATHLQIEPAPGSDGIGIVSYKVTNTSPGVWHYEYAIYNQNMDRGIQSFSVPVGSGASLSNVGFHAPPQHPGWTNDGTFNSLGYSSTPWDQSQANGAMTWISETFAQNQNANAIRWGTLYNFRFDSNRPPTAADATIGFFKTGSPMVVQIQGPSAANVSVSGRVTSASGRGVTNAVVSVETAGGTVIGTGITNRNGSYVINNIPMGSTYTIRVTARGRFTFMPSTMPISDNVTNADFVAN